MVSALNGTSFPVPRVHALCADRAVLGTEFYVKGLVNGRVLDGDLSTLGHPLVDFNYHAMVYRLPPSIMNGLRGKNFRRWCCLPRPTASPPIASAPAARASRTTRSTSR